MSAQSNSKKRAQPEEIPKGEQSATKRQKTDTNIDIEP